jgi:metal-sulfur cluster biosynthetic enzyme
MLWVNMRGDIVFDPFLGVGVVGLGWIYTFELLPCRKDTSCGLFLDTTSCLTFDPIQVAVDAVVSVALQVGC